MIARCLLGCLLAATSAVAAQVIEAPRRPIALTLTEVAHTDPDLEDLQFPFFVQADSIAIYVYDVGRTALLAYDYQGKPLWSFGRKGSGPGEFRSVWDFKQGRDGKLYLYDSGTLRMTVVDQKGNLVRTHQIESLLDRFLPLKDGSYLGHSEFVNPFLLRFAPDGKRMGAIPVPPELRGRDPIQSQIRTAVGRTEVEIVASTVTDRFYLVDSLGRRVRSFRGIDTLEYPSSIQSKIRISADSTEPGYRPGIGTLYTTRSIAVDPAYIYILMGSATKAPYRMVDRYSLTDGRYSGSFLLPDKSLAFEFRGDYAITIQHDPAPQVRIWRIKRP
jgi:hypothetical protein